MKREVFWALLILLAVVLYTARENFKKDWHLWKYRSAQKEKEITPAEKRALQKNMTLQEVMHEVLLSHGTWPQIFKETSLDADLADPNKFFIVLVVPTEIMVAPFMPTEAAVKNCFQHWDPLSLDKKIKVAKNYIISTDKMWEPKDGTEHFKTLSGKKVSITIKDFSIFGKTVIEINSVRAYDCRITRNGVLLIMSDLVWKEDKQLFEC